MKQKRSLSFLLLLTFGLQAMFAQGMMAGNGTWVELCTGDSASVSLVFLADNSEGPSLPEHQAEMEDHCLFSAFSSQAIQLEYSHTLPLKSHFLVSENFHPYANQQFWPARLSRAPPSLLG